MQQFKDVLCRIYIKWNLMVKYTYYLVAVYGGMVQNSCLATKLIGHNKS